MRTVQPDVERTSIVVGDISNQQFMGGSGSVSLEHKVTRGVMAGVSLMRSWRAPTLEELFSEGPHLAAYSYEIGNPELDAETGTGADLFVKLSLHRLEGRIAVFVNRFDSYIFPRNTGEFAARRADLYEYRFTGLNARLHGVEGHLRIQLSEHWDANLSGSYVEGRQLDPERPLPMMPPASGRVGFDHHLGKWTLTFDAVGAASQRRTGEFEEPTASWLRFDLGAQTQLTFAGALHTLSLVAVNVGDTSYRQHLNRVKVILPEPGRNAKLILRTHF
jgi:iron complex outermembrane receptor protein